MKIKLNDGNVVDVPHDEAVLLVASGKGERALPEPEEKPKKKTSKAKG